MSLQGIKGESSEKGVVVVDKQFELRKVPSEFPFNFNLLPHFNSIHNGERVSELEKLCSSLADPLIAR